MLVSDAEIVSVNWENALLAAKADAQYNEVSD